MQPVPARHHRPPASMSTFRRATPPLQISITLGIPLPYLLPIPSEIAPPPAMGYHTAGPSGARCSLHSSRQGRWHPGGRSYLDAALPRTHKRGDLFPAQIPHPGDDARAGRVRRGHGRQAAPKAVGDVRPAAGIQLKANRVWLAGQSVTRRLRRSARPGRPSTGQVSGANQEASCNGGWGRWPGVVPRSRNLSPGIRRRRRP
jgi:hypothetical protein